MYLSAVSLLALMTLTRRYAEDVLWRTVRFSLPKELFPQYISDYHQISPERIQERANTLTILCFFTYDSSTSFIPFKAVAIQVQEKRLWSVVMRVEHESMSFYGSIPAEPITVKKVVRLMNQSTILGVMICGWHSGNSNRKGLIERVGEQSDQTGSHRRLDRLSDGICAWWGKSHGSEKSALLRR